MDILERLKAFLSAENEKSGNGWPEIPSKDLDEFASIILEIIKAKWGEDCDGELPIKFSMYDKKKRWMPYFSPLPHAHKLDTPKEKKAFLRALLGNVEMASLVLYSKSFLIEEWLEEKSSEKT